MSRHERNFNVVPERNLEPPGSDDHEVTWADYEQANAVEALNVDAECLSGDANSLAVDLMEAFAKLNRHAPDAERKCVELVTSYGKSIEQARERHLRKVVRS